MSFDQRLAMVGLIVALVGIAITIFVPTKRWVGTLCLIVAGFLVIFWIW